MLVLATQILLVGLVILGLHALKGRLGLALIFVFVASNQFVQNLLATTVYVDLLNRYPVSPGSAVLFSSSLFALLLIYLKEDIATTQRLIYGILLANLTLAAVALSTRWGVAQGQLEEIGAVSDWFAHYEIGGLALGTGLLVADAFLLIILYETLRSRVRWIPEWLRIVLSLLIVLWLDTAVFVGVVFRGEPGLVETLVGNLAGKGLAGVLYGSLLWGYLKLSRENPAVQESREIRDPLSILTFGERYRLLRQEVEQLERLRERERQRAEIALRGARLGAWDWLIQTGETFHDDLWAEMLGYSRESIEARIESWENRIHPDDRARVEETLNAHLDGASPFYEVEHRLRTRTGEWKWILSMGRVVEWTEDGRPLRMTGTHMDIHERKLAEERAARFSVVLEGSLNEVYTFDAETLRFEEVNRGARENLRYTIEELRRLSPLDIKPEFTAESFAELLEPLRRRSQRVVHFTTVHLRKDGTRYPVEVHLQLMTGGAPVFVAIILDITERRRAESELLRLERRYRELFEGAPLQYVITESRGDIPIVTECNSTFLETLGYERDEVVGRPLSAFYTPESSTEMLGGGGYQRALEGQPVHSERQLVAKSGEVVETLLRALPETDSDGKVTGTRAMYVDISDRKRAETKLRHSERQLRRLAARLEAIREEERKEMSREIHDELGQALTSLKIDLSWMGQKLDSAPSDLVERVESMISTVDRTIEQVRDLSARLRPAVLDDLGLGEAVRWQAREFANRSGLECSVDLRAPAEAALDCEAECATAVFRILQEALTNVLRHAEASRVEITLGLVRSQLELRVEDDGKGIGSDRVLGEGSLGLLGMRERAEQLGGSVETGASGTGGAMVVARIPL